MYTLFIDIEQCKHDVLVKLYMNYLYMHVLYVIVYTKVIQSIMFYVRP